MNNHLSIADISQQRGCVQFQILNFTEKIQRLTSHLKVHKKDYSSQKGLRKILAKRQRLLAFFSKKNQAAFKEFISTLDIQVAKTLPLSNSLESGRVSGGFLKRIEYSKK
jgi:small subunit ribosomal protein S15